MKVDSAASAVVGLVQETLGLPPADVGVLDSRHPSIQRNWREFLCPFVVKKGIRHWTPHNG